MAVLHRPDQREIIHNYFEITAFLEERGIGFEKWIVNEDVPPNADQERILQIFAGRLEPYMVANGYRSSDVINVNEKTPNVQEIRAKFLKEHTHSEDEVRFFVKGEGLFWFHLNDGEVFSVLCQEGDLLNVPANFCHWFDLGERPYVTAIRIFTDPAGWVANYTGSGIDEKYNPQGESLVHAKMQNE